ncbi:hypothetical protein QTG54_008573 [Skeletonema marinoi]|uniref:Methyltransferase type 11 domain-containing protein n=1 Tax=Skeletonema marinoi TaxID=267567 RepID=A0AAD8Y788_9STRA|nr:hypothetical protein QTG54_008573 [Skeletonema marinoi]
MQFKMVLPKTLLTPLLFLLVLWCICLTSAKESVRDQFRNTNGGGECTTPGSCNDDGNSRGGDIRDNEEGMDLRAKLNARLGVDDNNNNNSGSPKRVQSQDRATNNKPNPPPPPPSSGNEDYLYNIPGEDPEFIRHLSSLETYQVPEMREALEQILQEMEANVGGITTLMQRHVERTLIQHQFPEGGDDTDAYATFGSLLDVSTDYSVSWNGSTEFGGKPSWVASMFYRKDIINYEETEPCRVDLEDDYDADVDDDECCLLGVTINDYVGIRPTKEKKEEHMILSAYWDVLDHGQWKVGTVMNLELGDQKFDTIVANGALTGTDDEVVIIMERLASFLNPGGVVFFVGIEPIGKVDGPEKVYNEILQQIESAKRLGGEEPTRNVPATFINKSLDRLGLSVFSSVHFPIIPTLDDVRETTNGGKQWIEESRALKPDMKKQYMTKLDDLVKRTARVAKVGAVFAREYQYIVAAELPGDGNKKKESVKQPTVYQPKTEQ